MIPVSPLRSSGESLRPTDIPLAHIRQHEPDTRARDKLHLQYFGVKQQRKKIEDLRIPMAPCPNIDGYTGEPVLEEPKKVDQRYFPQGPEWDIPFILRHRFFNWVYPILEAEFSTRAEKMEMPYGIMDTTRWKNEFLHQAKLKEGEFMLDRGWTKGQVYEMADQIRHAAEHRRNMSMVHIQCGLTLPEVFGNDKVYAQIMSAFELVCVAGKTTARDEPQVFQALDEIIGPSGKCGTITELYTSFQHIIEEALFRYTERNHPEILADKGWTIPEHGEMPQWKEAYSKLTAKQDVFMDPYGSLLSNCLFNAGKLRVSAAHRKFADLENTLTQIHLAFRCLMVLGNFEAAIEAEILAEQYLTHNTRDGVLKRLANEYLNEKLPPMEDTLRRRRAARRRDTITRVLNDASRSVNNHQRRTPGSDWADPTLFSPDSPTVECTSSSSMAWGFEPRERLPTRSLPPLPAKIKISSPDLADLFSETSSFSMHPILRTVPVPYSVNEWHSRTDNIEDPWTVGTYEMPDPPKITSEAQRLKKALADAFEAEMLDMDMDITDVSGIPSTSHRRVEAAFPSDAARADADRDQTSAGDTGSESAVDEVAQYYERIGEQVPEFVHLSVRREIRLYYREPKEEPAIQEEEQGEPTVSEDEREEPATSEDEQEEPAVSEDEQEEPAVSEDEQEDPAVLEYEQKGPVGWEDESEEPVVWENKQAERACWEEERSLYNPDITSDIKW